MNRIKRWISAQLKEYKLLLKNIPALPTALFIVSIVAMNLLASKALVNNSWLALDAGITVSWISFLTMDMIVRRFGPKASIRISIVAALINVIVMGVFALAALLPGDWALNDYATRDSWWIILASTSAFIISGIVNSLMNWFIRKAFKKNPNSFLAYACSSYGSTFIGQFVDNLTFALIFTYPASIVGLWGMQRMTTLALFMFAITGAIVELLCQVIFSPIGFKVAERWRKEDIGKEYIDYMQTVGS